MIIVNLDVMLAKRKMKSNELADKIGITTASQEISWNTGQMNRNYIRRLSLGEDGR